jgi:sRNA-binding carbon storage regulator CsrA
VLRRELYDRIREENVEAARSAADLGEAVAPSASPASRPGR